jgi:cell division protein ZapA
MKQLEVQIMGQSYLLGCPEGGEASLLDAVERVDTAMCKIRDGGKVKARDRIAVLAALNLAFDLSDRGKSAAPATPTPTPTSAAAPLPTTPPTTAATPARASGKTADADPQLGSLLERLDAALGVDGRLI